VPRKFTIQFKECSTPPIGSSLLLPGQEPLSDSNRIMARLKFTTHLLTLLGAPGEISLHLAKMIEIISDHRIDKEL
jgi:hypothetical protein